MNSAEQHNQSWLERQNMPGDVDELRKAVQERNTRITKLERFVNQSLAALGAQNEEAFLLPHYVIDLVTAVHDKSEALDLAISIIEDLTPEHFDSPGRQVEWIDNLKKLKSA